MTDRISDHMRAIAGTVASATGAIASWQTQIEWALRVGASIGAIVVAVYTVRSIIRKEKKESEEKQ